MIQSLLFYFHYIFMKVSFFVLIYQFLYRLAQTAAAGASFFRNYVSQNLTVSL